MRLSKTFKRALSSVAPVAISTALMAPVAGFAAPAVLLANLLPGNENPPNNSPASGTAVVVVDPAANTLHVTVTFQAGIRSHALAVLLDEEIDNRALEYLLGIQDVKRDTELVGNLAGVAHLRRGAAAI